MGLIAKFLMYGLYKMSQVIPLKLFQTWHTKDLPPDMKKAVDSVKSVNPEFEHFLFDDEDSRAFIAKHFDKEVLEALDLLVPASYKSDLWRYCVLYIHGGIYLDIKYILVNGFKFVTMTDKEYYIKERKNIKGIYTGLMVCKAGNPILLKAIHQIVENVKNKYYGSNALDVTSTTLLGSYFSYEDISKLEFAYHIERQVIPVYRKKNQIKFHNQIVLEDYETYRQEQEKFQNTPYYSLLWKQQKIYKENERK